MIARDQKRLRNRPCAVSQFVFARIAEVFHEIPLTEELQSANEQMRVLIDRPDRRSLIHAADDLLGPKPDEREYGPFALGPRMFGFLDRRNS